MVRDLPCFFTPTQTSGSNTGEKLQAWPCSPAQTMAVFSDRRPPSEGQRITHTNQITHSRISPAYVDCNAASYLAAVSRALLSYGA